MHSSYIHRLTHPRRYSNWQLYSFFIFDKFSEIMLTRIFSKLGFVEIVRVVNQRSEITNLCSRSILISIEVSSRLNLDLTYSFCDSLWNLWSTWKVFFIIHYTHRISQVLWEFTVFISNIINSLYLPNRLRNRQNTVW